MLSRLSSWTTLSAIALSWQRNKSVWECRVDSHGTVEQAEALIKLPRLELFVHRAKDPAQQVELPVGAI